MSGESESLMLRLLREIRADIERVEGKVDSKPGKEDFADLKSEMKSLRADVGADLHELDHKIEKHRKEGSDQTSGLRRQLVEYHTSVIGHGILISEREGRVRRVEQHLNLPPADSH